MACMARTVAHMACWLEDLADPNFQPHKVHELQKKYLLKTKISVIFKTCIIFGAIKQG